MLSQDFLDYYRTKKASLDASRIAEDALYDAAIAQGQYEQALEHKKALEAIQSDISSLSKLLSDVNRG